MNNFTQFATYSILSQKSRDDVAFWMYWTSDLEMLHILRIQQKNLAVQTFSITQV